jgi:predicted RecB family nuclease
VIYQGTLAGAGLFGRPDFLVRADLLAAPDGELRPGGRHYEVVDAKLARTAKARAVLQTAFYSRLLAELQGPSRAGCIWRLATGSSSRSR